MAGSVGGCLSPRRILNARDEESCAQWPSLLPKLLCHARGMHSHGRAGGRRGLERRSSGWARPRSHWSSSAVPCSPVSTSDWARGVVVFGAREAIPRAPSYKFGGFARGFAHPAPQPWSSEHSSVCRWCSPLIMVRGRGRPPSTARAARGSRSYHATASRGAVAASHVARGRLGGLRPRPSPRGQACPLPQAGGGGHDVHQGLCMPTCASQLL